MYIESTYLRKLTTNDLLWRLGHVQQTNNKEKELVIKKELKRRKQEGNIELT